MFKLRLRPRRRRRPCPVKQEVKIICPNCGAIVIIPMCQAIDGEKIFCPACRQEFSFSRGKT